MHRAVLLLPKGVPDLLEWMDHAATWQTRRLAESYPLRNLRDAIATSNLELTTSFISSATLLFRDGDQPEARTVAQFFAAMTATLAEG